MPYREVFAVTAPTKPASAPVHEIGYQQAVGQYMWWLYENETTPELIWPQSVYVYDQMRRTDSQVGSILRAVNLLVLRTPWRVDPNGARDEVVELVANDLGLPIVGQSPKAPPRTKDRFSWKDHLTEALLMLPLGYSYFEQVYRIDADGGRAHLRKLALRPARTIEYVNVADDGGLISIKQYWVRSGERPQSIPVDHLVAYIHAKEGGNWLGTSILRNCYKNWLLKDRLLRVQAQTIERNGMGIPLYTGPEGATDLSAGLAMAKAWRAGEAAGSAVPYGATLKLVGVEGTLPDAEPAIRYHDESIAKTVLAHFLNLGQQMGTGSYALGTTLGDFFTLGVQTVAQQIADVANSHVVEDLVDLNFGEDEPAPRITFDEIGSRQAATAQALKLLIDAGVIHSDDILEESTRQQYGLPPRDPNAPPPGPLPGLTRETLTGPVPGSAPADNAQTGAQSVAAKSDPKAEAAEAADELADDLDDDEATDALIAALDEFEGRVEASFNPAQHPRNPKGGPGGGRFRSLVDRIGDALDVWKSGDGHDDPLKGFDRTQLRTVAKTRGISLKRGAPREDIARAILDDLKVKVRDQRDNPTPKPNAKFTLKGGKHRNKDVGVYQEADGKVSLYEESGSGARGARVVTVDDLAGLERWANDNGETELTTWAANEGGTPAVPAKKAAPAKRAPRKAVPEAAPEPSALSDYDQAKADMEAARADVERFKNVDPSKLTLDERSKFYDDLFAAQDRARAAGDHFRELDQQRKTDAPPPPAFVPNNPKVDRDIRDAVARLTGRTDLPSGGMLVGNPEMGMPMTDMHETFRGDGYVYLADLRDALGEKYGRQQVDQALIDMFRDPSVRIIPISARSSMSQRDHDSVLKVGNSSTNDELSLIKIDPPAAKAAPATPKAHALSVLDAIATDINSDPRANKPAMGVESPLDTVARLRQRVGSGDLSPDKLSALLDRMTLRFSRADGDPIGMAFARRNTELKNGASAPAKAVKKAAPPAKPPTASTPDATLATLRDMPTETRRDALDLRKMDDLKAILRESGLPVSGRKRDLVDRLVGHLDGGSTAPAKTASAKDRRVATMATRLHEDWRKTRLQGDGSFEPRVKATKDEAWIAAHGTDQVDIANTDYAGLPNDWKAENQAAAEVIDSILQRNGGKVDLSNEQVRDQVGEEIHQEWLKRNDWAKGGELDVPFVDLSRSEQDKDIDQLRVAMGGGDAPGVVKKAAPAKAAPPAAPGQGLEPGYQLHVLPALHAPGRYNVKAVYPDGSEAHVIQNLSPTQARRELERLKAAGPAVVDAEYARNSRASRERNQRLMEAEALKARRTLRRRQLQGGGLVRLREQLAAHGLDTSGTTAQLINRLLDAEGTP